MLETRLGIRASPGRDSAPFQPAHRQPFSGAKVALRCRDGRETTSPPFFASP